MLRLAARRLQFLNYQRRLFVYHCAPKITYFCQISTSSQARQERRAREKVESLVSRHGQTGKTPVDDQPHLVRGSFHFSDDVISAP
jgi:hypothetical protein